MHVIIHSSFGELVLCNLFGENEACIIMLYICAMAYGHCFLTSVSQTVSEMLFFMGSDMLFYFPMLKNFTRST